MDRRESPIAELRSRDLITPLADLEGVSDLPRALFAREALNNSVVASARAEREAEPLAIADLERIATPVKASVDQRGIRQVLLRIRGDLPALVQRLHTGEIEVSIAAQDAARALELAQRLAGELRIEPRPADPRVAVAFWSGADGGILSEPAARWRRLDLPRFSEIEANYPASVRAALRVMVGRRSGEELPGRLALWHGPPGTGKTWALRALGREWGAWCELHYVTDPERLLGGDASHMLKVLAGDSETEDPDREGPPARRGRWRLLVLEDAGELLGIEAPAEVGRGFARLLNIVDGLLGQGTRALVLVTTNEPLGKLHPAVLRPGRAIAQLEFPPLSTEESRTWLSRHGVGREPEGPATIAELHAIAKGEEIRVAEHAPIGFG